MPKILYTYVGKTEYYVGNPKFYVSNSKYYVGFLKAIVKKSMINTDISTSAGSLRLSSEDETKKRPARRNSPGRPLQCLSGSAEYLFPKTIVCTAHSKPVPIRPPNFIFHQNMFCKHRLFRQKSVTLRSISPFILKFGCEIEFRRSYNF